MRIETLALENCRRFAQLELEFAPGLNLIVGPNGSGKTTILEAAFVLSYGRSFRRGSSKALARDAGGPSGPLRIVARLERNGGQRVLLGLERREDGWTSRIDGRAAASLNELLLECAVCCFEPGSHELIAGSADLRRAFLDWGVFHVEPAFLEDWRRYSRALKHANVLMRKAADADEFAPWFRTMELAAEPITHQRESYLHSWRTHFAQEAAHLLPELGRPSVTFEPGWDTEVPLMRTLTQQLARDRQRAHVSRGPHRANWSACFELAPRREHLSRGQEKLVALAAVLAQAALYAESRGDWPILLFDDLPSELDLPHQRRLLERLAALPAQVLITATERTGPLAETDKLRVFHVEQDGSVTAEPALSDSPS